MTVFTRYRWTPLHFRWAPDPETINLSLLNEDICPCNWVSWHRVTVCEVARVNFNPVLEERVAFVITFVRRHICYSSPITTLDSKVVRNVKNPHTANIWGSWLKRKISGNYGQNSIVFFQGLLWYDKFWPSLDSRCSVLEQWYQKLDGRQWRVVVR